MGDRGQVHVIHDDWNHDIWLYTHWGASNMVGTVRAALARELRWGDPEYLTRIIFDQMTEGRHGEETGFGIGNAQHGDVWRVVEVDVENHRVRVIHSGGVQSDQTFEEFVNDTV